MHFSTPLACKGASLLNSGAGMTITNGVQSVQQDMEATDIGQADGKFDLFGCLDVQTDGQFTFTHSTPNKMFFNGNNDDEWNEMKMSYC